MALYRCGGGSSGTPCQTGTVTLSTQSAIPISTPFAPKTISVITSGSTYTCAYMWDANKDSTKMWGVEGTSAVSGEQVVSHYREAQILGITSSGFSLSKCNANYGTTAKYVVTG